MKSIFKSLFKWCMALVIFGLIVSSIGLNLYRFLKDREQLIFSNGYAQGTAQTMFNIRKAIDDTGGVLILDPQNEQNGNSYYLVRGKK